MFVNQLESLQIMALLIVSILLVGYICGESISEPVESEKAAFGNPVEQDNNDLNPDASTYYSNRYSEWGSNNYPYRDSVTGYGLIDDTNFNTYRAVGSYNYYGYDNNYVTNSDAYKGYNTHYNYRGNGGYGGYGGNGGLNSYYGYNQPNYQDSSHLGYGYNKMQRYGNIYNNGITPSLVTGYRGYSKK